MQVLINTKGVSLSQRNGCFLLKQGDRKTHIAPGRVSSIVISNAAVISSQAIVLAMEHNIDLSFLNRYGDPIGRFWYGNMGRSVSLRRRQLEMSGSLEGLSWGLSWLSTKLQNQAHFLKKLRSSRPGRENLFCSPIERIEESQHQILHASGSIAEIREFAMGCEGAAARAYFQCISSLLPESYRFSGRSRRPARDPFNATLNYAYGILYSRIERACLLAGLDPYAGFLHADHPYRPALVCDLIEAFRGWADRTIVYLFTGRKIKEEFFDHYEHGVFLGAKGKETLVPALQEFLDERIRYRKRNVPRGSLFQHEAHRLANQILTGETPGEEWFLPTQEF